MALERQAKGFFQRMNNWVNGQSSNNAALKLSRSDLIGSMAGRRNSYGASIYENEMSLLFKQIDFS